MNEDETDTTMKKEMAKKLDMAAEDTARAFSNPEREFYSGETFKVHRIVPHSEMSASVVFLKDPTGKYAAAYFFIKKNKWDYFFPTDSHLIGMRKFEKVKAWAEKENFDKNLK